MSRQNEEFGGLLGAYLEGVRQAYYPVFSGKSQSRKARLEEEKTLSRSVKKAGAEECCGQMTPMLCSKS